MSGQLEERVRSAAGALGYVPDAAARALRGHNGVLVILADEIGADALAQMAAAATATAALNGLTATVSSAGQDPQAQLRALRMVRSMRPHAIMLTGGWVSMPDIRDALEAELREYVDDDGGRVVIMGPPSVAYPSVGFDDRGVAVEVAMHMASRGATSAVILAGPEAHRGFRERCQGFIEGLQSMGVSDVRVAHSLNDRDSASAVLSDELDIAVPEIVLSVNDRMAVGAYDELDRRGLRIPEDVAVSGVDDVPIALDLVPALTTVRQPFRAAGEKAVQLLLGEGSDAQQIELRGELIVRGSSPIGR